MFAEWTGSGLVADPKTWSKPVGAESDVEMVIFVVLAMTMGSAFCGTWDEVFRSYEFEKLFKRFFHL